MMVLIAALVIGAFCSFYVKTQVGKGDFSALHEASVHAFKTRTLDAESLGYYPPSGRPILMLFSLVPQPATPIVWWLVSAGLHVLCLILVVQQMLPAKASDPLLLMTLIVFAMLPWYVSDLSGGNISPVMLASVVVAYVLYRRGWLWTSATVLAVGIAVKFLPVFLIFFYILKRKWNIFWRSVTTTIVIAFVPGILIFGAGQFINSWKTWNDSALARRTGNYMILESRGISYINQSLANVLLHTLSPVSAGHHDKPFFVNIADLSRTTIRNIWIAVVILSGVCWVWLLWPTKNDPPSLELAHFAFVCLPMVWFCPHVMSYYMTILMPAVAMLVWYVVEMALGKVPALNSLRWLVGLYVVGCALIGSVRARAYGNYLGIILVLAIALTVIARRIRIAGRSAHAPSAVSDGLPATTASQ